VGKEKIIMKKVFVGAPEICYPINDRKKFKNLIIDEGRI